MTKKEDKITKSLKIIWTVLVIDILLVAGISFIFLFTADQFGNISPNLIYDKPGHSGPFLCNELKAFYHCSLIDHSLESLFWTPFIMLIAYYPNKIAIINYIFILILTACLAKRSFNK